MGSVHLFGIRHHGAGSAKRLQTALEALQPDILLIEAPEELDGLYPHLREFDAFEPPVAALVYNPKDFRQSVSYPFTGFSPEWNAMRYAMAKNIPIINMDLPLAVRFARDADAAANDPKAPEELLARDPIGYIAQLAGYNDGERWWEVMFELTPDAEGVFETIAELMRNLRHEQPTSAENLQREACMRQALRRALKEKYERIAVVCGAFHVPALEDLDKTYKAKEDAALLKSLPKIKGIQATWIPWTYQRIAAQSGYGAGVIAPAWYKLLYETPENAAVEWLVRVAEVLRKEDFDTSSAHLIETVRLAEALAAMRGRALPTMEELSESVVAVLLGGDETLMGTINERLIIGNEMGAVPKSVPVVPLQQDLEEQIKLLKLGKFQTPNAVWLKATKSNEKGGLDLREEHDRLQSRFLHRLGLLNINWGTEQRGSGRELSTKNEYWRMCWQPEFALSLISASVWGHTIESAATACALDNAQNQEELGEISKLLQKTIKAELPEAVEGILQGLQEQAARSHDAQHLMATLPSLVQIVRYGDVRKTDTSLVMSLIREFVPRIALLLPFGCTQINEEKARALAADLVQTHRALALLNESDFSDIWAQALENISNNPQANFYLQGLATRLRFDARQLPLEKATQRMSFALSRGQKPTDAGAWIEGFMYISGLLLLYNPELWAVVDSWVDGLDEVHFIEIVPMLRRAFAKFSKAERARLLALAQDGYWQPKTEHNGDLDPARLAHVRPMLELFLGLG